MWSACAAVLTLSVGITPPLSAESPAARSPADLPSALSTAPTSAEPVAPQYGAPAVPSAVPPGTGCAPACPDPCGSAPCYGPGRAWVSFEWLYWAASGQSVPPLITAAPAGVARTNAGTLGNPITDVLFGGRRLNKDFRDGFRLTGGVWLNDSRTFGIEGDFFFLGRSRDFFAAGSDGSQVISRPFFNALLGRQDVELVSFPGTLAGTVTADVRSSVIGGGVNAVHNLCCDRCGRVDLLYGYRYFNLTDDVTVREDLTSLGGTSGFPAGVGFRITDRFRTENNFHGGLIGISAERRFTPIFFGGVRASVAFGSNRQTTDIEGATVITPPGGTPVALPGGLLAQPSNIGRHDRTEFAVLPEVAVRAGVQLTSSARFYVGYNFLYLSNVARAGDQIDPRVNAAFLPPATIPLPGPNVPAFPHKTTDFWLQGVNAGVQLWF